jgi:hypothetical protein
MPPHKLTPAKYWGEVQLLLTEIEEAIIIHHTYEEINRLAVHDQGIRKTLSNLCTCQGHVRVADENRMVRRPMRRKRSASAITVLISLMPLSTALKGMN